jgi:hypothetical protein
MHRAGSWAKYWAQTQHPEFTTTSPKGRAGGEHELYKVVLSVKISGCAQKAGTLDKDVKRAVKAAQDHAINLTRLMAKEGRGKTAKFTQSLTQFHISKM